VLDAAMVPIVITASSVPHFDIIAAHLEREEGRVPHAYVDSLGYLTIGVGRLIDRRKGGHLTDEEIDHLLANDIRSHMAGIEDWPAWQAVKDEPARATALISMAFQLGVEGLAEFKNSLRLIAQKQWQAAAAELMQSAWAHQTPNRAHRVTQMIATGVLQ
jgi:lysozyme